METFITNLKKLENELSDWNVRIWMLMVESATVHRDSSITFKFRNGITIETS